MNVWESRSVIQVGHLHGRLVLQVVTRFRGCGGHFQVQFAYGLGWEVRRVMVGALSRISSMQDEREKLWADWGPVHHRLNQIWEAGRASIKSLQPLLTIRSFLNRLVLYYSSAPICSIILLPLPNSVWLSRYYLPVNQIFPQFPQGPPFHGNV